MSARTDFLHKATAYLAEHYRLIVIEDLEVKQMTRSARGTKENPDTNVKQKAGLDRSILETAPGRFHALLVYKAEEAGTRVREVDPAEHAPTQTCHRCGERTPTGREDRTYRCGSCGLACDRDYNAARVLLNLGLLGEPVSPDRPRAGAPARRREGSQKGSASETPSLTRQVRSVG